MDVGLHCFLGLHRLRPIHAHLVCEHSGRDAIFHHPKHRIVVDAEHGPRGRPLLHSFPDFAFAVGQKGTAPALYRGWMDCLHANVDMYIIVLPACMPPACISASGLGFVIAIGATLGFVYLRLVPDSLFPVRDRALIESLNLSQLSGDTESLRQVSHSRRRCPHGLGSCFFSPFSV